MVTTTSNKYAAAFGFTEEEVFEALDQCGLGEEKDNWICILVLFYGKFSLYASDSRWIVERDNRLGKKFA